MFKTTIKEYEQIQIDKPEDLKERLVQLQEQLELIKRQLNVDEIQQLKESEEKRIREKKLKQVLNIKREKGLNEIFMFYCAQHTQQGGQKITFEDLD